MKTMYFKTDDGEIFSITKGFEREDLVDIFSRKLGAGEILEEILDVAFYTEEDLEDAKFDAEQAAEDYRDRLFNVEDLCNAALNQFEGRKMIPVSEFNKIIRTIREEANY